MAYPPDYPSHLSGRGMKWDHKINFIGTKVPNPRIHLCEKCNFPIYLYGRMIPCKHVFCFDCAKSTEKSCMRCGDRVTRVEQSLLGNIYLCEDGGPKHSHSGCRRTYLSQRDLQAHINHRHKKQPTKELSKSSKDRRPSDPRKDPRKEDRSDPRRDPRTKAYSQSSQGYPSPSSIPPPPPPPAVPPTGTHFDIGQTVVSSAQEQDAYHMEHVPVRKSNLITVPLQDSGGDYHEGQGQIFGTPAGQGPVYSGPSMPQSSDHQATYTVSHPPPGQMAYTQHPSQGVIVAPQTAYGSPAGPVPQGAPPPPSVPYSIVPPVDPQNPPVVHFEGQPPMFGTVPIRPPPPYSVTSVPATGASWASPTASQATPTGPPPSTLAPPHNVIPDSSSYHGQYYQ